MELESDKSKYEQLEETLQCLDEESWPRPQQDFEQRLRTQLLRYGESGVLPSTLEDLWSREDVLLSHAGS
jgi:hypothetical protein